jgi:anti-anti-sigma factor
MCCWDRELAIDIDEGTSGITVVLRGELDLSSHQRMYRIVGEALEAATRGPGSCVIDTAGLHYVDCSSLRALASLSRRARDRGIEFALLAPTPIVRRMLRLTGYDSELQVVSWSGVGFR